MLVLLTWWINRTWRQNGALQASIPVVYGFLRGVGHHADEILPGGLVHHNKIAPMIV